VVAKAGSAARREGASTSRARFSDRYNGWLRHHRLSATDSLYRVVNQPFASLMTWLVIGIALALPVGLDILLDSAAQMSGKLDSPAQLSVFLQDEVSPEEAVTLQRKLAAMDMVAETEFISREQALEEFRSLSGFADVLDNLQRNPLPSVILLEPVDGTDEAAIARLQALVEAEPEVAQTVLDLQWLQRLNGIMELARRAVLAVGGILIMGVVLILGNTLRLAIENRRDEILVTKLVGGSNAFVRRPFLYTGLWYGVGGGVMAVLLVSFSLLFLGGPVAELAALYQSNFALQGRGFVGSLDIILLGAALGLAGAWLAVSRHLGDIEPR
jgi:cell division transport system permease protein